MTDDGLSQLRALLRVQTDALFEGMSNLCNQQTKALARALQEAQSTQTQLVVRALDSYVVRIFNLEREVAALREGRPSTEWGPMQ
jgi:hypothetical protein